MNEKANNKSIADESKVNEAAKESPPLAGGETVQEDMSSDEMAMFNKIMGEIEGPDQTDNQTSDTKVAKDAGSVESSQKATKDEALDEDQQKAFESIMAQIEGGNDSDDTDADADDKADDSETVENEDDFAAELEKVAKEAEATTGEDAAPEQRDAADEELDEDQQKALESIMAQIEGGNDSDDTDADANDKADDSETVENEDDFAAELEKVAKEAEATTGEDTAPEQKDAADEELDEDQQKALESIIAQIEGDNAQKESSDADKATFLDAEKKETSSPNADPVKDEPNEDADSNDNSDDIEGILKEITSDLEEPDVEDKNEKTDADELEIANGNDDDVVVSEETEDTTSEAPVSDADLPVEKPAAEELTVPEKKAPEAKATGNKADRKAAAFPKKASPLPKVNKSRRIVRKVAIYVSALMIFSLCLSGYYYWSHLRTIEPPPTQPMVEAPVLQEPSADVEAPQSAPLTTNSSDQFRLETIGNEIDQLRDELIAKRKEIEELREYYQTGIDAEIQNLVNTIKEMDSGRRITYKTAMADPLVSMGIKAIQRRDSYINKLKNPSNALYLNSEELFYLYRKAALLAMMTSKTSDIDIDSFLDQAHVIMAAHRNALAQLNIDNIDAPDSNLDLIWQRIDSQLAKNTNASVPVRSAKGNENEVIWAAMCSGNFSQKHKLTALSPEAARCLAGWKGKDLFLNGLTTLAPEVARQLADWKGEWLGLNGLKSLSPEAAGYLVKWKGKGLSLNGLSRLSPRLVAILSEWQGDQIELINVKHMAHWENPKTRLFLSEEISRKVNEERQ